MTGPTTPSVELDTIPTLLQSGLPEPVDFTRMLRLAIETGYARERAAAGGETLTQEQSYALQRQVAGSLEKCQGFKASFEAGRKLLSELQNELTADVMGEQDGVVTAGYTIPDREGDIRITPDTENVYEIDTDELAAATAATVIGRTTAGAESLVDYVTAIVNGDADVSPDELEAVLADALMDAMRIYSGLGKFEPQITKVKAYAAEVARRGDDGLSAQVAAAVVKTVKSKGVKMSRKAPPKPKAGS